MVISKSWILILFLIHFVVVGQDKKKITSNDFQKWAKFSSIKWSKKGDWFAYKKSDNVDNLYIQSTIDNRVASYSGIQQFEFAKDSSRILLKKQNNFQVYNLETRGSSYFFNKEHIFWAPDEKYIIWLNKDTIAHENGKIITGFSKFFKHPSNKWGISFNEKVGELYKVDLQKFSSNKINKLPTNQIIEIFFDETSDTFVYVELLNNKKVYTAVYCGNTNSELKFFKFDLTNENQYVIQNIKVENDKVYFNLIGNDKEVKITDHSMTYSIERNHVSTGDTKYYCWYLLKNKIQPLFNDLKQDYHVTDVDTVKILADESPYDLRDFNGIVHADFYAVYDTGKKHLIVENLELLNNHFIIVPNSNFVVFYKEGLWFSYDLRKNVKKILNKNIPDQFNNSKQKYISDTHHFGALGIIKGSDEFLVYDEYDIWKLSLNGGKPVRLTSGRENGVIYRDGFDEAYASKIRNILFRTRIITTDSIPLILTNPINSDSKIVLLINLKNEIELTDWSAARIKNIKHIIDNKYFVQQETIDRYGDCYIIDSHKQIHWNFELNQHLTDYYWQKSIMINTKANDGEFLRGGLIYPANYDANKEYPMIVYIYEKVAHWKNKYWLPTYLNSDGFNASLLSQNGYFVFLPDLRYKRNEVGKFIVDDLRLLINQAKNNESSISVDRVGIMGHSFGGYQVMYIVGQTNFFKGAVAGAGVSDLYDFYYEEPNRGSLGYFTIENSQFQTDPPFQNKYFDLYNPIRFVDKIQTPILMWSGENDYRIRKEHSKKMYLALWRQKKNAELIIYKNEAHVLNKPENQKDLSIRIIQFFDKVLKRK